MWLWLLYTILIKENGSNNGSKLLLYIYHFPETIFPLFLLIIEKKNTFFPSLPAACSFFLAEQKSAPI
jgi:hypothetical protein